MTTQLPDVCWYDGRRWDISDYIGDTSVVPQSELLGFRTSAESSANWSGRIDHYMVFNNQLYFFKMQVHLTAEYKEFIPQKARKELVIRTERMTRIDETGTREVLANHEFVFFIFDNLNVPYTGKMVLHYPHTELWEYPCDVEAVDYQRQAELWFKKGTLINELVKDICPP